MRWLLHDGSRQLQLYAPLRIGNVMDAELFLRRFRTDPTAMQTLRDALRSTAEPALVHKLHDDEVIRRVAALLASGRLHLGAPDPPPQWPIFWYKGEAKPKSDEAPAKEADSKNDSAKVPMEWKLAFSDGPAAKGFVSLFEPQNGAKEELKPDGQGHHKKDNYWRHDPYDVTFMGTIEVTGKVEDSEGKPAKDVIIYLEPAYGEAVLLKTDGGGAFKAKGFIEEEEFDLTLRSGGVKVAGKFVDSDDKPVPGVQASLFLDGGDRPSVQSDAQGKFEIRERLPEEGFSLVVDALDPGFAAEGKFVDGDGKPLAGVMAVLYLDGGGQVSVVSDDKGSFRVPGLFPGEGYSLDVK